MNRYAFLLESLRDLDCSLRKLGTRLYVVKGNPLEQIQRLCKKWDVKHLTFEADTEPYALARDTRVREFCSSSGICVSSHSSHTLHDPFKYIASAKGKLPKSYQGFNTLFAQMGAPRRPEAPPAPLPSSFVDSSEDFDVPTLEAMGYPPLQG